MSPVPFGGGSYADVTFAPMTLPRKVTSPVPFGGGSYADGRARVTLSRPTKSPVPFGGGSYADQGGAGSNFSGPTGLQCLSAVGPMRTAMEAKMPEADFVRLQCLSAVGPMRTLSALFQAE